MVLEVAEDAQGTEKNKVVKVKPPRKEKPEAAEAYLPAIPRRTPSGFPF